MSILHYRIGVGHDVVNTDAQLEKRYERNALGDLKHGLDLVFALKDELERLHPIATEALIRML